MDKAYSTACILLHHMNCHTIHELVSSHRTNDLPAADDRNAIQGIESIISFLHIEIDPFSKIFNHEEYQNTFFLVPVLSYADSAYRIRLQFKYR